MSVVSPKTRTNSKKKPTMISDTNISEVDKDWGNKLWDAIKQTQDKTKSKKGKPPLDEIDFDQKTLELEMRAEYEDARSEKSQESKAETLKMLPSYMAEYKAKSAIKASICETSFTSKIRCDKFDCSHVSPNSVHASIV